MKYLLSVLFACLLMLPIDPAFSQQIGDIGEVNSGDGELNVRTGPSTNDKIIHVFKNGDRVKILERSKDWARVSSSKANNGWVYVPLLAFADNRTEIEFSAGETAYICNSKTDITNVRYGPSAKEYSILEKLKNGHKVEINKVVENSGGYFYYEIIFTYDGEIEQGAGYVYHKALKRRCNNDTPASNVSATIIPKPIPTDFSIILSKKSGGIQIEYDTNRGCSFMFSGSLAKGDFDFFREIWNSYDVKNLKIDGICLSGSGYEYEEGLKFARFFQENKIHTTVIESCFEACAIMFLAGYTELSEVYEKFSKEDAEHIRSRAGRTMKVRAKLGFHPPYQKTEYDRQLNAKIVPIAYEKDELDMRFTKLKDALKELAMMGVDVAPSLTNAVTTQDPTTPATLDSIGKAIGWKVDVGSHCYPHCLSANEEKSNFQLVQVCKNTLLFQNSMIEKLDYQQIVDFDKYGEIIKQLKFTTREIVRETDDNVLVMVEDLGADFGGKVCLVEVIQYKQTFWNSWYLNFRVSFKEGGYDLVSKGEEELGKGTLMPHWAIFEPYLPLENIY